MIQEEEIQRPPALDDPEEAQDRGTPADVPSGRVVVPVVVLAPFILLAMTGAGPLPPIWEEIVVVGYLLLLAAAVLIVARRTDLGSLGWARLDRTSWLWILGFTAALSAFGAAVQTLVTASAFALLPDADRLARLTDELSAIMQGEDLSELQRVSALLLDALIALVLAPIIEEFVYRGFLLRRWAAKWGAATGLVLSSLVFAAVHPLPAIDPFIWGLVLGVLYLWTQNLLVPIAAHFAGNVLATVANHAHHALELPVAHTFLSEPERVAVLTLPFLLLGGVALGIMLYLVKRQEPGDVRQPWTGGQLRLGR